MAKTKITIEMTGYEFAAEINHDANIKEMVELFKALLVSHKFNKKLIEDEFFKQSFNEDYEEVNVEK